MSGTPRAEDALKRKADDKPEGERSPKRSRPPDAPSSPSKPARSETERPRSETERPRSETERPRSETERSRSDDRLPSKAQCPVDPRTSLGTQITYSSWMKPEGREKTRLYINREFDGYVGVSMSAGDSHNFILQAPYRTSGSGTYESALVGQFSTPTGYVTARVATQFIPWGSPSSSTLPVPSPALAPLPRSSTPPPPRPPRQSTPPPPRPPSGARPPTPSADYSALPVPPRR